MRKPIYTAIALATLAAAAPSRAEVPGELYCKWDALNDKCLGLGLDDPEGIRACKKRREVLEQIREYRGYDGNRPKRGG